MESPPDVAENPEIFPTQNRPTQNQFGKLPSRHALTATVAGEQSRLLYVTDVITKVRYLVNTDAEVNVLPANSNDRLRQSVLNLQAASGKPIATYGKRYIYLNLSTNIVVDHNSTGLRKPIHWIFAVADVSMPIIGIDLLQHHNLLIDTRKRRLVDVNTNLSACVTSFSGCRLSPVTIKHTVDPLYQPLIGKYPGIHQTQPKLPCVTSNVKYHITTAGPHVFSKARRLAPEKLRLVKNEFDHMIDLGIIRPSNNPYASPLHMVPKKDSND
ncbi:hypothetical protein MS3_00007771 [Schistosoma haematobium]|uniref:Uncharacterized protein n=1 Tax=Schistosoma haematobium TaxID=6185 RepID=A0A6A5D267_SCHHA|nr:hypothetical protein MS3_00007771 [Schistosoma haematobium]KAH9583342.1 hypothetical protein MS3_00007771 [Schistosoma haematobium]